MLEQLLDGLRKYHNSSQHEKSDFLFLTDYLANNPNLGQEINDLYWISQTDEEIIEKFNLNIALTVSSVKSLGILFYSKELQGKCFFKKQAYEVVNSVQVHLSQRPREDAIGRLMQISEVYGRTPQYMPGTEITPTLYLANIVNLEVTKIISNLEGVELDTNQKEEYVTFLKNKKLLTEFEFVVLQDTMEILGFELHIKSHVITPIPSGSRSFLPG